MAKSEELGFEEEFILDDENQDTKRLVMQGSGSVEYGATRREAIPESHLGRSLLAMLFCCGCGLLALINSLKVGKLSRQGDLEAAKSSSAKAVHYSTQAFQGAVFFWLGVGVLVVCAAFYGILEFMRWLIWTVGT